MKHDLIEHFKEFGPAPNSLPGMPLITRYPDGFECKVCGRRWQRRPSGDCAGIRCYPYGQWPKNLMTKTQLGQAGYKNDDKSLPAAAGYYNTPKFGRVYLYDRQEATVKKVNTYKRLIKYIEAVTLPESSIPLFECLHEKKQERMTETTHETLAAERAAIRDIAELVSACAFFTADEIAQITGSAIPLKFRIAPVRRQWPEERVSDEMTTLVELVYKAFRRWQFKPKGEAELIEGEPLSSQDLDDLGYFRPDSDKE